MTIKQLSVFLQNRPGHLAEITDIIRNNNINIKGINVSEGNEFGIVRLIIDDIHKTKELLEEQGYLCRIQNVLAIEPEDRIGLMADIFNALAEEKINVNYIYSIIKPLHNELPIIIMSTSNQDRTKEILKELEIPLVISEELIEETTN